MKPDYKLVAKAKYIHATADLASELWHEVYKRYYPAKQLDTLVEELQSADAEAVQNDQKNALFHYAFTPFLSFCAHLRPFGAEVRLLLSPIIGDERTFRKRFIAPASITKI